MSAQMVYCPDADTWPIDWPSEVVSAATYVRVEKSLREVLRVLEAHCTPEYAIHIREEAHAALASAPETAVKPDQWVQDGKVFEDIPVNPTHQHQEHCPASHGEKCICNPTPLLHETLKYPCGCSAAGPYPLPIYCGVHGSTKNRGTK